MVKRRKTARTQTTKYPEITPRSNFSDGCFLGQEAGSLFEFLFVLFVEILRPNAVLGPNRFEEQLLPEALF